jgi:uncharacterized protein (DUF305 family)
MRVSILAAVLMCGPAFAQSMPGMAMPGDGDAPSTKAYKGAMMAMDKGMDIPYTGNADQDFVAGMIPHHQGAVAMAKVELQYGHDPQLKRLAREIIAAQDKEIAFMKHWQASHPAK